MASSHPGLPVQVRDSVLAEHERVNLASEDVNRGFQIEQLEKAMENGSAALPYGKVAPSALLQRMARKQPYYKRNQAHICSFFVRGECNRGSACPYRYGHSSMEMLLLTLRCDQSHFMISSSGYYFIIRIELSTQSRDASHWRACKSEYQGSISRQQ